MVESYETSSIFPKRKKDEITKLKELVGQKDDDMKNYKKEVMKETQKSI